MAAHSPAWFARQEARLQEPIKNTVRYLGKSAIIKIFAGLPTLILPVVGIIELYKLRKSLESYSTLTTAIMNNGRAVTNDGPPGTGKTFTGSNVAYMLALEQWHKLKSDYYTQRTMVSQWVKTGESDKLEAFQALEQSYNFFKEHEAENIPCLVSSVPLREYGTGRMSFKLTPELFRQIERVPEYTVIFNDESGLDQGAETSKTDDKDLLAFWRFCRHFFDGMFINTNQDGDQNGIYMRRSTDYVNHIYGQKWLFEPLLLKARYERKERRYYKRLALGKISKIRAEYIGQVLYYLKKYIATIGFRRVTCRKTTSEGASVGDIEEIILPAIGGVQYDNRAYRKLYKCKDKPIKLQGWERLAVDESDGKTAEHQSNTVGKEKSKRAGA